MIITNIPHLTSKHIEKLESIYNGEVKWVNNLQNESACDWSEAKILLSYGDQIDATFLDRCPNLKWVQAFQSGVELFPMEELRKRNITLTNILGIHSIPMSEYVLSMILYFVRDFPRFLANQKEHYWDENEPDEAFGKTVGIFGAGTIGKEIAKRLDYLGMNVYGMNTSGQLLPHFKKMFTPDKKAELLQQCDFVVLILPLTKDTENFIDKDELVAMKKEAYLINIGRGPLINEKAFMEAIKNKEIKGAALDVFDVEPLPKESDLWDLENVLITPHAAAQTVKFIDRCIDRFEINYKNYINNKPLNNQINLDRGY